MTRLRSQWLWLFGTVVLSVLLVGCHKGPEPGQVQDEARLAGRPASSFPAADEDYFHDMDGAIALTSDEVKGRNMWIVWTGGDDRLWDTLTVTSVGTFDLLKTVSSYPGLKASRDNRWNYLGLVNEPCFKKPPGPIPTVTACGLTCAIRAALPIPSKTRASIPGVKIGARGKNLPVGSYYGYATGIVGLRLFPNPDFDEAAAKKWDAEALLHRSQLLQRQEPGAAVSRRHVVRLLPCWTRARPIRPPIRRTRSGRT